MKSLKKKQLIIAEINRLYWEYFPPNKPSFGPDGKQGVVLCVKGQDECDQFDYNFLDKELIYMAAVSGSRQKYIKMTLKRMKINESVSSDYEYESSSLRTSSGSSELYNNRRIHLDGDYSSFKSETLLDDTDEKEEKVSVTD